MRIIEGEGSLSNEKVRSPGIIYQRDECKAAKLLDKGLPTKANQVIRLDRNIVTNTHTHTHTNTQGETLSPRYHG